MARVGGHRNTLGRMSLCLDGRRLEGMGRDSRGEVPGSSGNADLTSNPVELPSDLAPCAWMVDAADGI